MATTLSIGGATYDLFVRTGGELTRSSDGKKIELPLGGKVHVEQVLERCGGGASNTAVGLHRLGCEAAFMGILGSDQWGEALLKNFQKEGIDTRSATIVEGETTSFSIILSAPDGERTILYDPGTNAHLHDMNFDKEKVGQMDWIYLNHIHESSCVIENDLIEVVAKRGIGLTWNPGGCHLRTGIKQTSNREMLAFTRLLLMNKEEALQFTGETTVERAIRTLLATGTKVVCVTDGRHGAIASDGKHTFHCPTLENSPIVDTTGAGDAFGIGATWALIRGLDLPTMLRAGTINATSVLGQIGAEPGLLTESELTQRLTADSPAVTPTPL